MPSGIRSLPYDLVHAICGDLDVRSFVHLSRSDYHFYQLLKDEASASRCLQGNGPHPSPSQPRPPLWTGPSTNALLQEYDHVEAIRTGKPYSVSILAHATSFCYSQGTLLYSTGKELRVLEIHSKVALERVVTQQAFSNQIYGIPDAKAGRSSDSTDSLSILQYCDGVAVILYEGDLVTGSWLFAVDVRESRGLQPHQRRSRFLLCHRLTSVKRLFVRHSRSFLYFGTYSVLGPEGHYEWLMQGFDLATGAPVTTKPFQLRNFVGAEVGSTAAFAIHGDCFYAVSNQSSHESEEIDWTSYYDCICFPVFDPKPDTRIRALYRRQHREGPINDAFTNLSLQVDRKTNDLLIVECRKEWLKGGSTNIRSYYIEKLLLSDDEVLEQHPSYPPNDPLVCTIDSRNKPRYEEERERIPRQVHHDYKGDQKYEYIRAKTKYHTYQTSANSFVDLVTDNLKAQSSCRSRERILLRIASRIPKSPLELDDGKEGFYKLREPMQDKNKNPIEDGEEEFQSTEIHLWPPDNAPSELLDILCPGGRSGNIQAALDDRSLVYMAGTPQSSSDTARAIVMISFDPTWGYEGMKRWTGGDSVSVAKKRIRESELRNKDEHSATKIANLKRQNEDAMSSTGEQKTELLEWSSSSDDERVAKKRKCEANSSSASAANVGVELVTVNTHSRSRNFWKEPARFLSLKQGFWLR